LHAALRELALVANPRAAPPILGHVLLVGTNKKLTLRSTDFGVEITHVMAAEGDNLAACVPAALLMQIVKPDRQAENSTIEIEQFADDKISVIVDGVQSTVNSAAPADYPSAIAGQSTSWSLVAEWPAAELHESLGYALVAMSNDSTRPNLCTMLLDRHCAVATDGHRLHMAALPGKLPQPMLLRSTAARMLHRLLPWANKVRIGRTDDVVRFHIGTWLLDTRIADEVFPQYRQVVPAASNQPTQLKVDAQLLARALRRIERLSGDKHIHVRVNGALCLGAGSSDMGEAKIELPVIENTHRGEDLVTGVNARYLFDALPDRPGPVGLGFSDPLGPLRVDAVGNKTAVIMPVRV